MSQQRRISMQSQQPGPNPPHYSQRGPPPPSYLQQSQLNRARSVGPNTSTRSHHSGGGGGFNFSFPLHRSNTPCPASTVPFRPSQIANAYPGMVGARYDGGDEFTPSANRRRNTEKLRSSEKKKKQVLNFEKKDLSTAAKIGIWLMGTTPCQLEKVAKAQQRKRQQEMEDRREDRRERRAEWEMRRQEEPAYAHRGGRGNR
ncbi:hypothetical protein N0V88_004918 [Collariella sp. IMI 366227]|nr:hypothetical protein N0V88_004918 [Collariella sp. IMI 366227]